MVRRSDPSLRPPDEGRPDSALLILRFAALFLLVTFGREKLVNAAALIRAGQPLTSGGLAPLIRALGFPFPGALAIFVVLAESLGAALVFFGVVTRPAAAVCAVSMAGAFYSSLRLREDPIRALLYFAMFATLAAGGAGRYSAGRLWRRGRTRLAGEDESGALPESAQTGVAREKAFLVLRAGMIGSLALLVGYAPAEGSRSFSREPIPGLLAVVVVLMLTTGLGVAVRPAGVLLTAVWIAAGIRCLATGLPWYALPVRAALYAFVFAALAAAAPGGWGRARSPGRSSTA